MWIFSRKVKELEKENRKLEEDFIDLIKNMRAILKDDNPECSYYMENYDCKTLDEAKLCEIKDFLDEAQYWITPHEIKQLLNVSPELAGSEMIVKTQQRIMGKNV